MNGTIKFYNDNNGYGFIYDSESNEYFFHVSDVESVRMPEKGDAVTFNTKDVEKGTMAVNVKVLVDD